MHELEKLKRTNMPFYYIQSDHLKNLRNLKSRLGKEEVQMHAEVDKNLEFYEKTFNAYKKANPHLYKSKPQAEQT